MAPTLDVPSDLRQPQSRLLSLPLELLIEILGHLADDRRTLCALARTSRLLQPFSEDQIYHTVELFSTDDLQTICHALSQSRRRVEAVHRLKILYKWHNQLTATTQNRSAFNRFVAQMKALQEWHIESPCDNNQWTTEAGAQWVQQDMDTFRQALEASSLQEELVPAKDVGLAKLQHLTIHSHGIGADFWDLDEFSCLFRHPTLRYLHISCVTLPLDLPDLEPYAASTPLQTLVFDECELEPESLRRILSTPKSLKHLTLGENIYNIHYSRSSNPKLTSAADAAMRALSPVANSLETLTHHDPTFATVNPAHQPRISIKGDGMRHFYHLRHLSCDPCSFLHQGIILDHNIAPPNLETLRLLHYNRHGEDGDYFDSLPPVSPYTYLASLKSLEFVQPLVVSPQHLRYLAPYICEESRLRERHAAAFDLHQSGKNMVIYAEACQRTRFIPPYLHGETLPELLVMYDASDVGFTHHPYQSREASNLPESKVLTDEDISIIQTHVHDTLHRFHVEQSLARGLDPNRRPAIIMTLQNGAVMLVEDDDDDDGDEHSDWIEDESDLEDQDVDLDDLAEDGLGWHDGNEDGDGGLDMEDLRALQGEDEYEDTGGWEVDAGWDEGGDAGHTEGERSGELEQGAQDDNATTDQPRAS